MIDVETAYSLGVTSAFTELMQAAIGKDSIYIRTKETLTEFLSGDSHAMSSMTQSERAQILSQALVAMSTSVTSQAMSAALATVKMKEELLLLDAQITTERNKALDLVSATTVRNVQSAKDLLVKQEQIEVSIAQKTEVPLDGIEKRKFIVAQTATEGSKKLLVERQTKGFDDDAKQKLLKQSLDSWSVAYSVAQDANAVPDTIKVNPIDSIMKNAMDSLSISTTINPLGQA